MPELRACVEILLIEDNPADADLFETFFRTNKDQCRLHHARDGEEALQFLNPREPGPTTIRPHLVILDINIPKIDGKEVLREIKSTPRLRSIPVIVLTSSESEDDIRCSYEAGASCVLIKPSDLDGVLALFRTMEAFWVGTVRYAG